MKMAVTLDQGKLYSFTILIALRGDSLLDSLCSDESMN